MRAIRDFFKAKPSGLADALGTKGAAKLGSQGKMFTHAQDKIYDLDLKAMTEDCFKKYKLTFTTDEQGYQELTGSTADFTHPEGKDTHVLSTNYDSWMTLISTELTPYSLNRFICSAQCTSKENNNTVLLI